MPSLQTRPALLEPESLTNTAHTPCPQTIVLILPVAATYMSDLEQHPTGWGMRTALAGVFLWFFLGGIAHFIFVEAQMRIVPPYIPWPRAVVLVSGGLEILGAMGLLWLPTRQMAAWGLFALTLAVTPANIFMLKESMLFPTVPYWMLVLRLPLQAGLLLVIAWIALKKRQN